MQKERKKFIIKLTAGVLSVVTTTSGVIYVFKNIKNANLEENNFDGYYINDLNFDYSLADCLEFSVQGNDVSFNDVLNSINTEEEMNVKKAKALYYAIQHNSSLKIKEKENLKYLIPYFIDNKYIEHEFVFDKLMSFTVNRNNSALLDEGISAEYLSDNSITFANNDERKFALSHEIFHCIENEALPYEYYAWFGEGMACLNNYEYLDHYADGNNMKSYFIRALCEIIGSDAVFKTSATGDSLYLATALLEKGIDNKKINTLFQLFQEYNDLEYSEPERIPAISNEIINLLIEMYNTAYNEPEFVSENFYIILEKILDPSIEQDFNYYYLNSVKKIYNKVDERKITQNDLLSFYDRMKEHSGFSY